MKPPRKKEHKYRQEEVEELRVLCPVCPPFFFSFSDSKFRPKLCLFCGFAHSRLMIPFRPLSLRLLLQLFSFPFHPLLKVCLLMLAGFFPCRECCECVFSTIDFEESLCCNEGKSTDRISHACFECGHSSFQSYQGRRKKSIKRRFFGLFVFVFTLE